jgi:putative mRNA 3-end processing factor
MLIHKKVYKPAVELEIKFLGGAGEVGRSAMLLKGSSNLLLDYGAMIDDKTTYPLPAGRVDACVLSHAHLDHCGAIPTLYKTDFPVTYGTSPTKELAELLIDDSLKIAKKNHEAQRFSKRQVREMSSRFATYGFGPEFDVGDYAVTLHDAGHICGSSEIMVRDRRSDRKLVYTGDFKLEPQILQGGAELLKSDILMIESTYADREHPDREELKKRFISEVRETLDSGGTALVPVFAVGRAQEMIALLYKSGLISQSYIDGMAKKATEIELRHPEFVKHRELLDGAARGITWLGTELNRSGAVVAPGVIVTTAGMLNGGPVLNYLSKLRPNSKIFITGYQVEGTNGRSLLEGKPLTIDGEKVVVKTPVAYYDFSAHAGKSELYRYVKESGPETVICVHGEAAATQEFAENLRLEGFDAHAPKVGEELKLEF